MEVQPVKIASGVSRTGKHSLWYGRLPQGSVEQEKAVIKPGRSFDDRNTIVKDDRKWYHQLRSDLLRADSWHVLDVLCKRRVFKRVDIKTRAGRTQAVTKDENGEQGLQIMTREVIDVNQSRTGMKQFLKSFEGHRNAKFG